MDTDFPTTVATFAYIMAAVITYCSGCNCCDGCKRTLHGGVEKMTIYGFYDYAEPSVLNSSQYLTSLLDTAPCPPPWKLELLCFRNTTKSSILSCSQQVYLLNKCLGQPFGEYSPYLCTVLSICRTFLTCSDFSVQFSNQLSTCSNVHSTPKLPQTVKPSSAAPTLKLTTEVTTSSIKSTSDHSTLRNNDSSYNVADGNTSTLFVDGIHTHLTTEDTSLTIPRNPASRGQNEDSRGLSPLAIFFILFFVSILIVLVIIFIIYRRKRENYKVTRRQWSVFSKAPLHRIDGGYAVLCFQWKLRKNGDVETVKEESNELIEKAPDCNAEAEVKDSSMLIPSDLNKGDNGKNVDDDDKSSNADIRYIDESFEKEEYQDEKKDYCEYVSTELSALDKNEKEDSIVTNSADKAPSGAIDRTQEDEGFKDFVNGVVDLR